MVAEIRLVEHCVAVYSLAYHHVKGHEGKLTFDSKLSLLLRVRYIGYRVLSLRSGHGEQRARSVT